MALFLLLMFLGSSFFLTRAVLPLVSRYAGLEIAAASVTWHPLRAELQASGVRIGSVENSCFQTSELACRYDLAALLQGRIALRDIVLKKAFFSLYSRADGSWSCFPVPETGNGMGKQEPPPAAGENAPADSTLQFDLRNITLHEGTFRLIFSGGTAPGFLELRDLSGTLDSFRNSAPFRLKLDGALGLVGPDLYVTSGRSALRLEGAWASSLAPSRLAGTLAVDSMQGIVNQQPVDGDSVMLKLDAAILENGRFLLKELAFRQLRGGETSSDFELTGEIGFAPFFLRSSYDFRRISEEVLALLCDFSFKLNPGRASLSGKGETGYENGVLTAKGELHLQRSGDAFRGEERIPLPELELKGAYDINVDLKKERTRIGKCNFSLLGGGKEPLSLRLLEPVDYSWHKNGLNSNIRSPELELLFRDFDLKVIKFLCPPVAGFQLDSGLLSAKVRLRLSRDFSQIEWLGDAVLRQLAAVRDGKRISLAELSMGVDTVLRRNLDFAVRNVSLSLREEKGSDLGGALFSAQGNLKSRTGSFQGRFERLTPQLAIWIAPEMMPLAELWERFGLRELNFDFGGEIAPGLREVAVEKLSAVVRKGDGDFLDFRLEPVRWSSREAKLLGELRFQIKGRGEAVEFNELLKPYESWFDAGRYRFDLSGEIAPDGVKMTLRGDSAFEDVAFIIGQKKRIGEFSFQNTFTFYRSAPALLEAKELNFFLRRAGKPALRLECPGVLNIDNGDYQGEWSIRYLNEHFVRLWMLPPVPLTRISGKMQLTGKDFFRKLRIAGGIDLNRLLPPESVEAVSGNIQFVADGSPELFELRQFNSRLQRGGEALFDFSGSCRADRIDRRSPVQCRMRFGTLQLDRLASLWKELIANQPENMQNTEEKSGAESSAPPAPPRLYSKERPVELELEMENVTVSADLRGGLQTRFHAENGEVKTESLNLKLNDVLYQGKFRGSSRKKGVYYDLELKGSDPLSLRAVLNPYLDGSQEDLGGSLKRFELALRWLDDGSDGSGRETLNGTLGMGFSDLVIPNTVTRGAFGRVLLAPLEILASMDGVLPREIMALRQKLLNDKNLHKKLQTVSFSEGNVQLSAVDGKVTIGECRFTGDWIRRLLFSGTFLLGGEQTLDLESQISVGGFNLNVPVSGTLNDPEVTFVATAANNVSEIAEKLKEFNLIGTMPAEDGTEEPVIVIDELPTAATIREIGEMFKDIWNRQDDTGK